MSSEIQFETPENIQITYRAAGPGTRFVAWIVDNILVWLLTIVLGIVLLLIFGAAAAVFADVVVPDQTRKEPEHVVLYAIGVFWVFFSLSGFIYFGMCEFLMRGQTLGKRQAGIRVVKADGFALDPLSIMVRTVFRVVDHLPPLWIVPLFTEKSQRLGDLVAGTVVVTDQPTETVGLQDLANRNYADCRFRFDVTALKRVRPQDIEAVERVLERWGKLKEHDRDALLDRIIPPLAGRLQVDVPAPADRLQFLEDLLSAEYRRQLRKLG